VSKLALLRRSRGVLGFGMVMATITLIGFVAFQFLDAQDNTQVATTQETTSSEVATIETPQDVETVTQTLETAELDNLDSELDAEFNF
jgi:hypothetical protein